MDTDFLRQLLICLLASLLAEALSFVIPDEKIESLCRLIKKLCLKCRAVHNCGRTKPVYIWFVDCKKSDYHAKKKLSLQDIVTSVTECIRVVWILKNMRDTKIPPRTGRAALYFLVRNHKRERASSNREPVSLSLLFSGFFDHSNKDRSAHAGLSNVPLCGISRSNRGIMPWQYRVCFL